MTINETTLFTYLRRAPFGKPLTQTQVDGVRRILKTCEAEGVTDVRQVAYILASVYHETGTRMTAIKESVMPHHKDANPSDATVISRLNAAYAKGKLGKVKTPYWRDGWFGRGEIQITHRDNYEKAGRRLGVDLLGNPSLALNPEVSSRVAVIGMKEGWFTGKTLSDYFSSTEDDPIEARRIVNGKDEAVKIAGYHRGFLAALTAASTGQPEPATKASAIPAYVVKAAQEKLRALGYYEVGKADGLIGPKTAAAVSAFQTDNGQPVNGQLADVLDRLDGAPKRKVSPERASTTIEDLRKGGSQIVKEADRVKKWAWLQGVFAFVMAAVSGISDTFSGAWSMLAPIREALAQVPWWVWGLVALAVAFWQWHAAQRVQDWRLDDERTGRHAGVPVPEGEG